MLKYIKKALWRGEKAKAAETLSISSTVFSVWVGTCEVLYVLSMTARLQIFAKVGLRFSDNHTEVCARCGPS